LDILIPSFSLYVSCHKARNSYGFNTHYYYLCMKVAVYDIVVFSPLIFDD
jgi:hypothetical protein